MKPSATPSNSGDSQSTLDAPPRPGLHWIRCCLILLFVSSSLHFPAPGETASFVEGSALIFFGIALAAGGIAILIGLRNLLIQPGALLILLGFGSIGLAAIIGFLRGHPASDLLNALAMPLLFAVALATTHVAACAGIRAGELVRHLLIAIGVGFLWQLGPELLAGRTEAIFARPMLPIAGTAFFTAWLLCTLLLRRAPSRKSLIITGIALAGGALAIWTAHGNSVPLLILPAIAATVALVLGSRWRFFSGGKKWLKFAPAAAFLALGIGQLFSVTAALQLPRFDTPIKILAVAAILVILMATATLSLRSARRNSETVMGRWAGDAPLMFLPFVGTLSLLACLFSGTALVDPLAVVMLGALAAMPQCFFNRAYYLRHRENEAAISPQLILSEEDLPTNWKDAFPLNA